MSYKIFMGANGYYVAYEGEDGFHQQPADNGARLGFDRGAAERALRDAEQFDPDSYDAFAEDQWPN